MAQRRSETPEDTRNCWDQVFEALGTDHRRQLIASLSEVSPEEPVPLPEGAIEQEMASVPTRIQIELNHIHLPKLDDLGFVDWDSDARVVYRGPRFDRIAAVLEELRSGTVRSPDAMANECTDSGR